MKAGILSNAMPEASPPLGAVAFMGYSEIAELLLEHGADAKTDQGEGQTPADFATVFGSNGVSAMLES